MLTLPTYLYCLSANLMYFSTPSLTPNVYGHHIWMFPQIKGLATHVKNALVNPKMNERQQRYAYVESGHLNTELMVVGFNYDWVHPTYKRAPIFCHNCTFIRYCNEFQIL